MKILLLNLPREGEVKDVATPDYLLYDFMNYPPLGLMAIASEIDPRHTVEIVDVPTRRMGIREVVEYVKASRPDLLGISVVTRRLWPFHAITRALKEEAPETLIVAGGPHVTCYPRETMDLGYADMALPGYGERSFPRLVEALAPGAPVGALEGIPGLLRRTPGGVEVNPAAEEGMNLDDLPFPDRRYIRLEDYYTAADKVSMTTMYTSRGCPFRCTFCDVTDKRFHYRSAVRIVDELEEIAALGIGEAHIFDDTFNVNRERVVQMCQEIIRRGLRISWSARARVHPADREMLTLMKQAGCRRLHVGVEALDDAILKSVRKGITVEQVSSFFRLCNELSIDTLAYFIVGFPGETPEYRRTLFARMAALKPTYVYINILTPLAGSEYYQDLIDSGVYDRDVWAEFIRHPVPDFSLPLPRTDQEQSALAALADDIHRRFYLSPRFVVRDLIRDPSPKRVFMKAKIAVKLAGATLFKRRKPQ